MILFFAILSLLGALAWAALITFANMMSDAPGVQMGYGTALILLGISLGLFAWRLRFA